LIRKWGIALLLGMTLPACKAERVTVAQLESILTQSQSLPDADLAAKLSDLQLTQRLAPVRVAHWRAALPGAKAQHALLGVADRSAFLALPAEDIPANAAPELADQRRILEMAATYVSKANSPVTAVLCGAHYPAFRRLRRKRNRFPGGRVVAGGENLKNYGAIQRGAGDRRTGTAEGSQNQKCRPGLENLGRVRTGAGARAGGRGAEQAGMGTLGTGSEWTFGGVPLFRSQE